MPFSNGFESFEVRYFFSTQMRTIAQGEVDAT